jgi:hypothetical protein
VQSMTPLLHLNSSSFVEQMIQQGERKRLLLANRAITEHMRMLEMRTLDVASSLSGSSRDRRSGRRHQVRAWIVPGR